MKGFATETRRHGDMSWSPCLRDSVAVVFSNPQTVRSVSMRTMLAALVLASTGLVAAQPSGDASAKLHVFLEAAWEDELRMDPLLATSVGDHRYDDRLPLVTREELERQAAGARARLAELRAIDRAALPRADRVSYDMYERQLADSIADFEHGRWRIPITADSGFHTGFAQIPREAPLATVRDYQNYLARLRAYPEYVRQHIAL